MPDDVPEVPRRRLRDPREMRAIAHPLRLRILEELAALGPATATELSERVGESPANCSWHLRLLARYGFVEEAGEAAGRRRPWRVVARHTSWGERDESAELTAAGDAATEVIMDREIAALREWLVRRRGEPSEWRDAAFLTQSLGWFTPEELNEINAAVLAVATRHFDRIGDPGRRPPGARLVRLVGWAYPDPHHPGHAGTGTGDA